MFRTAGLILILFFGSTVFAQQLIKFQLDNRWGYKDADGNVVIPAVYLFANDFNQSGTTAVFTDSGWVYINSSGSSLLTVLDVDNQPDKFSNGLARFVEQNKIGYFDESGSVIITPLYDFASSFEDGSALVCSECLVEKNGVQYFSPGTWMKIDTTGKVIKKLSALESKQLNAAPVMLNGKLIWINQSGQRVK